MACLCSSWASKVCVCGKGEEGWGVCKMPGLRLPTSAARILPAQTAFPELARFLFQRTPTPKGVGGLCPVGEVLFGWTPTGSGVLSGFRKPLNFTR